MSKATANLEAAQRRAMATRPKVGGFPHLAETLRRAGRHPQRVVFAFVPEPVSDQGRVCRQNRIGPGNQWFEFSRLLEAISGLPSVITVIP
jgi:hypothetical protein